jgi:hypothetical protein
MLLRASKAREDGRPPRVVVVQSERMKEPESSRYQLLLPNHEYFPGSGDAEGGLCAFIGAAS